MDDGIDFVLADGAFEARSVEQITVHDGDVLAHA
jgi:hypothetical protein